MQTDPQYQIHTFKDNKYNRRYTATDDRKRLIARAPEALTARGHLRSHHDGFIFMHNTRR